MNNGVVDLAKFRKGPEAPNTSKVFIVQDKVGNAHRIEADKMGTSPTALCFFKSDAMIFCLPLELLYVATIEDGSIQTIQPEATPEPVTTLEPVDGPAA